MINKFEVVCYDDYYQRFEVNIYKESCEEPETEYLPAVYSPEFEKRVEEVDDFFAVLEEWADTGKEFIIGFEYEGNTIKLDDENVTNLS